MCRHLAYLGPPATLRALLLDPPHGLGTQAWAPRRQCHGTMNVDGFGVDPVVCRATFRNWDYPVRRQIFAGFRTARDGEPPTRLPIPPSSGPGA